MTVLMRIHAAVLVVLAGAAGTAGAAHADPWGPRDPRAEEHRQRGKTYYQTQQHAAAIRAYRAGFALDAWPLFLFNLGQAHRQANQPCDATQAYTQFLSALDRLPSDDPYRVGGEPTRAVADQLASRERAACERQRAVASATPRPDRGQPRAAPGTRAAGRATDRQTWWLAAGFGLGGWILRERAGFALPGALDPAVVVLDFDLGRRLTPRLGVTMRADLIQGYLQPEVGDARPLSLFAVGAGVHGWVQPSLWLAAGLGLTSISYQQFDGTSLGAVGGAVRLEAGAELARPLGVALDAVVASDLHAFAQVTAIATRLSLRARWSR